MYANQWHLPGLVDREGLIRRDMRLWLFCFREGYMLDAGVCRYPGEMSRTRQKTSEAEGTVGLAKSWRSL